MPTDPASAEFPALAHALQQRLEVIADHAWRDRDAADHLNALAAVSQQIADTTQRLTGRIDRRLEHFLLNCSYDKALARLSEL
jgi:hypothetical protein